MHSSGSPSTEAPKLSAYAVPSAGRSAMQILTTVGLLAVAWYVTWRTLVLPYWVTLLAAIPAALLMMRIAIIQHDCGHGAFFRTRAANDLLGAFLGILTLAPYAYWRRTHAIHHTAHGNLDRRDQPGYIDMLTLKEYLALPERKRRFYRLYRNPIFLLFFGVPFQFIVYHRVPFGTPASWKREWRSVAFTNLGIALVAVVMGLSIGWASFLKVQLPVSIFTCAIGGWLFYVQHTFPGAHWARDEAWSFDTAALRGSSFYDLPPLLSWFTGDLGLHHVHHLNSRIPNYRLRECMRDNTFLQDVQPLRLRQSLDCFRLKLWDEERQCLVGFPRAAAAPAPATEGHGPSRTGAALP